MYLISQTMTGDTNDLNGFRDDRVLKRNQNEFHHVGFFAKTLNRKSEKQTNKQTVTTAPYSIS